MILSIFRLKIENGVRSMAGNFWGQRLGDNLCDPNIINHVVLQMMDYHKLFLVLPILLIMLFFALSYKNLFVLQKSC